MSSPDLSRSFATLVCSIAICSLIQASPFDRNGLKTSIEKARKAGHVNGLSVAVVKDGNVVFADGFGFADVAKRRRSTANTVYEIGSCTKSFTALLAAQAAQEGKLSLADSPAKYLNGFRLKDIDTNGRITIEDLLSHRSGLPRTDLAWYAGNFSSDELLKIASEAEPTAHLRQRWQYQNLMFLFSGMIESKVYGKTYHDLLKERFFLPLGMAHSASTYVETRAEKDLATGYPNFSVDPTQSPLPLKEIDRVAPAGSISSSVRDMSAYVQMLLNEGQCEGKTIFAKEAIQATRKPRIEIAPGSGKFYGLGWMLSKEGGKENVFHGGNIDGFTAFISLYPGSRLGVVVLSNADNSAVPQEVADLVARSFEPKEEAKKGAEAPAAAEEAKADELGPYVLEGAPVEVEFLREGKSTFLLQNGQRIALKLVGPKRYAIGESIVFTFGNRNPEGKPVVKLEQNGMKFTLVPRAPYRAPIDAKALLAKSVEARGGAEAVRRHSRAIVRYRRRLKSEAVDVYGIRYRRDMSSEADFGVFFALGRSFATVREFGDGTQIGTETTFSKPTLKSGLTVMDDLVTLNLEADLDPTRYYRSLAVVREDTVEGKPVYVVEKTTFSGLRISDFVSKADGRLLKRQTSKGGPLAYEEFSDFRTIDGLTMPFHIESSDLGGSKSVEDIVSVSFEERIPEWPFRAALTPGTLLP